MKEIELFFYGYTWEEYAFQISSLKGIFVIYKGNLDSEGFIEIKEVLYIGYHKGIIDLYDQKIIESIKKYIAPSERIFLSYAEVPSDVIGKDAASLLNNAVRPAFNLKRSRIAFDYKLICKGNCKMIPDEILG